MRGTTYDSNSGINARFAYTGVMFEESFGSTWHRRRWLDLELGQWKSEDPIKDGENWRAYVGNHPTYATDPSGLITREQVGEKEESDLALGGTIRWKFKLDKTYEEDVAIFQTIKATLSITLDTGGGFKKKQNGEVTYTELIGIVKKGDLVPTTLELDNQGNPRMDDDGKTNEVAVEDKWSYGTTVPRNCMKGDFTITAKKVAVYRLEDVKNKLGQFSYPVPGKSGIAPKQPSWGIFDKNNQEIGFMTSGFLPSKLGGFSPGVKVLESESKIPLLHIHYDGEKNTHNLK